MNKINFEFWSCEVKQGENVKNKIKSVNNRIHITMACFGEDVQTQSRTVVSLQTGVKEVPICVLTQGTHENQSLNLSLPNEKENVFTISGINPSSVYLTGYIQPLIDIDQFSPMDLKSNLSNYKHTLKDIREPLKKRLKNSKNVVENEFEKNPCENLKFKLKEHNLSTTKSTLVLNSTEKVDPTSSAKSTIHPFSSPKKSKGKKKFMLQKSGLGIRIAKKGNGPKASKGDTLRVRYIGQLDNREKTVFDKNLTDGFVFSLGEGDVIKGWDEGCKDICVNEKRKLKIPSKLAYGKEGAGTILPNANLIFTVECIEIIPKRN